MLRYILLILVIIVIYKYIIRESFYTCPCAPGESGGMPIQARDMTVVNPFIYPYSAEPCMGNIYNSEIQKQLEFAPLTHLSVPDHTPKSN